MLPVKVASPPFCRGLVLLGGAIHPRLKIGAAFVVTVLQVVLVAALPELDLGDLVTVLGEHHILLGVPSGSLFRFVESGKELATVFDLTVRGSFELDRHSRNTAAVKPKLQVFI